MSQRRQEEATGLARMEGVSLGTGGFVPQTMEQALQYANMLAESDMVPGDFKRKPGNIIAAMQMGAELGLKPMQSLQNIAVINGRPSVWGDALLALVRARKDCEDIHEVADEKSATCTVTRKGSSPVTRTFTREDAERARLWGKQGPWTQYPRRMLQMRARSFALRDAFPDVLRGLSMAEEAQDIDVRVSPVEDEKTRPKRGNAGLKSALGKAAAPPISEPVDAVYDEEAGPALVDEMLTFIATSEDVQALKTADWSQVDGLPKGQADAIRAAYKQRVAELSESPEVDPETGEVIPKDVGANK